MLKNYFNVALRSLLKNKLYSFINIFGLAVGIAAFLLLTQYIKFEQSYESSIAHADDIYRVRLDVFQNGEEVYRSSENYAGTGPAMLADIPEVIKQAKLYNMGSKNNVVITWEQGPQGSVVFKHRKFLYAQKDFLSLFSTQMVHGDRATALEKPHTIVISETMAKNYFGSQDPMGKLLRLEDDDFSNELCTVTGVFEDISQNTHLKYEVLISFSTILTRGDWAPKRYATGWNRKDFYTYVQLEAGTDPKLVEEKLPELVLKYKPDNLEKNVQDILLLQPIKDIHLNSQLTDEAEVNGNGQGIKYLSIIAFFILVIAWINYINLSTARSMDRAREVGLRKVMGSYRSDLIAQFLTESFVINFMAIILTFLIILVATPYFYQLGGTPTSSVIWLQNWFWAYCAGIVLIGSFLSGLYPAFVLSSFEPVSVLHGKLKSSSRGVLLRKVLVVFQFSMSVAMIIGTVTVFNQMDFMQNRDLGFNMERTIVVERPPKSDTSRTVRQNNVKRFKDELMKESDIQYVAGSGFLPGKKLRFKTPIRRMDQSDNETVPFAISNMDYDIQEALQLNIIAGRGFEEKFKDHEDTTVLITENGVRILGFDNPEDIIGKKIFPPRWNMPLKVIGVVGNYHQENLKEGLTQVIFFSGFFGYEYYMIKFQSNDLKHTIAKIETQWHKSFTGNPFHYFFLDEYFNSYYESEAQFRDMFSVFSLLAIIIGCLGLFGLSSFTVMQKTKEIAIRKVLGSSVINIVRLLSKEFLFLVLLATIITWPPVYYLMGQWLDNYPYRVDLNLGSFIASGVAVLAIAFFTISYHTFKSARANPVDALNCE